MEVRAPRICRVQQVEVGSLFVLVDGRKGRPICLRAAYDMPEEDADEANRVVPLQWPEEQQSVGVAVHASALPGCAIVLEDARLEVYPLSARSMGIQSLTAVYGRDDRLFFPISDNGHICGLVDAASGEILAKTAGTYVAFEDWRITVSGDAPERLAILPINRLGL